MGSNGKWHRFELGPVCTKIGSAATPRGGSKVYLDYGEVALIRSQNVYDAGFNRNGLVYINQEHAEQLSNVEVLGSACAVSVQHTLCRPGGVDQSADAIDGEVQKKETVDKNSPIFCREAIRWRRWVGFRTVGFEKKLYDRIDLLTEVSQ